jgi:methylmalonyl-CoA mutase
LYYEQLKHDGALPIVGVNTFLDPKVLAEGYEPPPIELRRASVDEKAGQIESVRQFQTSHAAQAPAVLEQLKETALHGGNLFAALMDAVRVASLGQISRALYEVGGEYRRNL